MTHQGDARVMRTRGPDGAQADFPVEWVIGGKRMQDTVTVFPDGRWQVLPVYFHVRDHAWVDYTEAKQGALTPEHPFYWTNVRRMANHECLDCHTTNLRVAHDDATGAWTTTATDFDVACESCHGPGGHHADTSKPADIVHPAHAGAVGLAACARCHGPRQPLWPLLDGDHAFRIGDDYDEAYDPIVVALPGGGMSSDFFADGRPATSSYEYQAMLQSACYRRGGATCSDVPHGAARRRGGAHAELRDDPDKLCRGCHATLAADHTHHKAAAAQRTASPATCRRSSPACSTRSPITRSTCPIRRRPSATACRTRARRATRTSRRRSSRPRSPRGGRTRPRARRAASGSPMRSTRRPQPRRRAPPRCAR